MKRILIIFTLVMSTGCLIKPDWKPVPTVIDAKTEIFQLSETEWASAKEFQATLDPSQVSKEDLLGIAGILYGVAEVIQSDTRFTYNVQIDDYRLEAINTRYNGKSITDIMPNFIDKVKGKFDFLTPGDSALTDANKSKAISQFKILAGGLYLSAQGK